MSRLMGPVIVNLSPQGDDNLYELRCTEPFIVSELNNARWLTTIGICLQFNALVSSSQIDYGEKQITPKFVENLLQRLNSSKLEQFYGWRFAVRKCEFVMVQSVYFMNQSSADQEGTSPIKYDMNKCIHCGVYTGLQNASPHESNRAQCGFLCVLQVGVTSLINFDRNIGHGVEMTFSCIFIPFIACSFHQVKTSQHLFCNN